MIVRGVPDEIVWFMDVNGERVASGASSAGLVRELAAGRLAGEGWVNRRSDVESIDHRLLESGAILLDARVTQTGFLAGLAEREHRTRNGCGLLHYVACDASTLRHARTIEVPAATALASMLRELFDTCDRTHPDGGVHAGASWSGGALEHISVDIARHAAVDKVIGACFLERGLPIDAGIVVTARISGQMAAASARAGAAWIASRSVPTTLAVRIASAAGMRLIARAASRDAHVIEPASESR